MNFASTTTGLGWGRRSAVALGALWLAIGAQRVDAETLPRFASVKTPGGITFHWRYDDTTPFAAINFGMRDIYGLTTRGKEGLSALGGSLVMQGADGAGQTEFIERLKDLTAGASISIGPFTTLGSVRAPPATFAPALSMVTAALKEARPSDKLLARLKVRAESGEAQALLRAETIAERSAMRFALGDHPITRAHDPKRFARIGVSDLEEWRKRNLDRTRLRIAASGRITQDDAARAIDDAFAKLPTGLPPQRFEWPKINFSSAVTIVVENETAQSAVLLIGATSIASGREVETGNVANAILGGGASGRLWQAARAGLGATYGASSGFMQVGPGRRLIVMRAAVGNDQVKAAVDALRGAYATWRNDGVTAAELKATTSRFANDIRSAFDDPGRANGLVLATLLANRQLEDLYTADQRLLAIGRDGLNQFIAAKFPAPEALLTVIVTPKADGLGAKCVVKAIQEVDRCRAK